MNISRTVMFHIGRSGSTVLADQLAQHPDIRWDGEIYETNIGLWDGREDPLELLHRRMNAGPEKTYGFEFKFFHAELIHLSLAQAIQHFVAAGFDRFIVLTRHNYLRKIVSSRIAMETSQWFIPDTARAKPTSIRLDVDRLSMDKQEKPLLTFLEDYDKQFAQLDTLLRDLAVSQLSYEDDIENDPIAAYVKVCEFLDTPKHPTAIRYGRTTPGRLRDIIENFDELRGALQNTPYEWMLNG
jgi:hypothetical protein